MEGCLRKVSRGVWYEYEEMTYDEGGTGSAEERRRLRPRWGDSSSGSGRWVAEMEGDEGRERRVVMMEVV